MPNNFKSRKKKQRYGSFRNVKFSTTMTPFFFSQFSRKETYNKIERRYYVRMAEKFLEDILKEIFKDQKRKKNE